MIYFVQYDFTLAENNGKHTMANHTQKLSVEHTTLVFFIQSHQTFDRLWSPHNYVITILKRECKDMAVLDGECLWMINSDKIFVNIQSQRYIIYQCQILQSLTKILLFCRETLVIRRWSCYPFEKEREYKIRYMRPNNTNCKDQQYQMTKRKWGQTNPRKSTGGTVMQVGP